MQCFPGIIRQTSKIKISLKKNADVEKYNNIECNKGS